MPNPPLSELLKLTTKSNHQQLEKLLVLRLRLITTKEEYINLLQLFYSFFGGLEERINLYLLPHQPGYQPQRRTTLSIAEDIITLGGSVNEKAKGGDLPEIENYLQALGALYVIEGSTLGGKIIVKMLQRQLNIENNQGLSFFSGYGEETESRWASFKELLNNQSMRTTDTGMVVFAANDTFAKFKLWIDKQPVEAF